MNDNEFKMKIEMIKKYFNDNRKIKCMPSADILSLDEDVHQGGDIFLTENDEFIDLEFQLEDFDEVELAKYIGFAENLYEKHQKIVSVYLICSKNVNVTVKEQSIKSESDFTIKLYCSQHDPCKMILNLIKNKISRNERLTSEDIDIIHILPLMCDKKDRNYFRVESLKIINKIT